MIDSLFLDGDRYCPIAKGENSFEANGSKYEKVNPQYPSYIGKHVKGHGYTYGVADLNPFPDDNFDFVVVGQCIRKNEVYVTGEVGYDSVSDTWYKASDIKSVI